MEMLFKKIIVCIDGSKHSYKALSKAVSISKMYDSKIFLIYVIEKNTIDFWNNSEYVGITSKSLEKRKKEIENMIKGKIKEYSTQINYQILVLEGHVSNEIIQMAKKKSVDLIVIGKRGLGKFKKMLLGSVSSSISEYSPCSVLIVK